MTKPIVAVLFGGYSGEASVSQKSAMNVFNLIDTNTYQPYLVELDNNRDWWLHYNGNKIPRRNLAGLTFRIDDEETIAFEVILNMIHGRPGESGELQGYFDTINVLYTGENMNTMVATFDKYFCQTILKKHDLPIAKNYLFSGEITEDKITDIYNTLKTESVFVKPNSGGSSLGSGIAKTKPELIRRLTEALEHDDEVLIEEYVSGREFSIGVINYNGQILPLPITEIIAINDFFDFEAKYEGASQEITPADITDKQKDDLLQIATQTFQIFNCHYMIRMEILMDQKGNYYILDINTIPGFTDQSILPQQLKKAGISPADFINQMIERSLNTYPASL